jgi:cytochrome b6-f complex iron-sulfur subunit
LSYLCHKIFFAESLTYIQHFLSWLSGSFKKENNMDRKEFFSQMGIGAVAILIPSCLGGLMGCQKPNVAPTNVDFTIDTSTGSLANNGGFLVSNGVVVARSTSGTFLAVSASCTHEGTNVNYNAAANNFVCPNHGAKFNSTGAVIQGPASRSLTKYNTVLTGTSLRVFS